MRKSIVTLVFAIAVTPSAAAAAEAALETRSFMRTGSLGVDTDVEFYLLEGTYRHELVSACVVAASIFPSDREPPVPLRDVLQADLATRGNTASRGTVEITTAGWAHLQVGTGPECEWTYTITGEFLPVGEEPPPPRAPDDLGGALGAALVLILLLGVVVALARTRRAPNDEGSEAAVRVRVDRPPD